MCWIPLRERVSRNKSHFEQRGLAKHGKYTRLGLFTLILYRFLRNEQALEGVWSRKQQARVGPRGTVGTRSHGNARVETNLGSRIKTLVGMAVDRCIHRGRYIQMVAILC